MIEILVYILAAVVLIGAFALLLLAGEYLMVGLEAFLDTFGPR